MSSRAGGVFERLFGADLRSLAAARIALASLLLVDLALRSRDLRTHYTDDGVFPRDAFLGHYGDTWRVSLHLLSGRAEVQAAMFALAAGFALALLVGYRTRLASFVSFVLLVSLQARNPIVLNGGDELFALLLLWGNFVPWGARFSLDAAAYPAGGSQRVLGPGTVALLAQMPVVYFFTALLKTDSEWRVDYTAVAYTLQAGEYTTAFGRLLSGLPLALLQVLCVAVLALELLGPLLMFSPLRTARVRGVVLASFGALQAGFGAALDIGLFPLVSTAALLPLLPSEFWTRLPPVSAPGRLGHLARQLGAKAAPLRLSGAGAALCLCLFAYGLADNLGSVGSRVRVPASLEWVGSMFRVYQDWSMFAPGPPLRTRWVRVEGELADGRRIDLFTGGVPSDEKPADISALVKNARWRKYFGTLFRDDGEAHRPYAAAWLCRTWNEAHAGGARAAKVSLYGLHEWTALEGGAPAPARRLLASRRCDGVEPLVPEVAGRPAASGGP